MKGAVLTVFKEHFEIEDLRGVLDAFDEGTVVNAGEDVGVDDYAQLVTSIPALRDAVRRLTDDESPAAVAGAVELVLEGLHLSKRLNKEAVGARATYRGRG